MNVSSTYTSPLSKVLSLIAPPFVGVPTYAEVLWTSHEMTCLAEGAGPVRVRRPLRCAERISRG